MGNLCKPSEKTEHIQTGADVEGNPLPPLQFAYQTSTLSTNCRMITYTPVRLLEDVKLPTGHVLSTKLSYHSVTVDFIHNTWVLTTIDGKPLARFSNTQNKVLIETDPLFKNSPGKSPGSNAFRNLTGLSTPMMGGGTRDTSATTGQVNSPVPVAVTHLHRTQRQPQFDPALTPDPE